MRAELLCISLLLVSCPLPLSSLPYADPLYPYPLHAHGSVRTLREVKECHSVQGRDETYEMINKSDSAKVGDVVNVKTFVDDIARSVPHRFAYGHLAVVYDPVATLSILEPDHQGSCTEHSTTQRNITYTSLQHNCVYAVNGGFFNTSSFNCLGNMYSDGRLVVNSHGLMNPSFGVLRNGSLVVGYLTEAHVLNLDFTNLVQGIIWLVRENKNYVTESQDMECGASQTTGSMDWFVSTNSARTAIGHDAQGNVLLLHVEGKTGTNRGINLVEFADLLIVHGFVNAVNLDGGGSAHAVHNGTLISYPSNHCQAEGGAYRCEFPLSSVICIHAPCTCKHGTCTDHVCVCHTGYTGAQCDIQVCPEGCSNHGACVKGSCVCKGAYSGAACNVTIPHRNLVTDLTTKELGIVGVTVTLIAVCIISITFNVYYCLRYKSKKPRSSRHTPSNRSPSLAPVPISVSEHQKRQIPIYNEIQRYNNSNRNKGEQYELQNKSTYKEDGKELLDLIDKEIGFPSDSEYEDDTALLLKRA